MKLYDFWFLLAPRGRKTPARLLLGAAEFESDMIWRAQDSFSSNSVAGTR